jgi:TetR/AcrR family transcriptional regulator, cholesterol catabolism regulator
MPAIARPLAAAPRRRAVEIVEAAAKVFAERGYHGTSTQAIADVLGIRQGSLYYYFSSKEEALEQVCMHGVEGFVERAATIAAGPGDAIEKIRALIHSHLAPLADRRDFVWVFLRERHHLPDASRRRVGRLSRRLERIVLDVFVAGVRTGDLRADLDCRLATLALLGMCNAVPAWYLKEPGATIDRIAAEYGRLLIDGATATPRRRGTRRSGT